MGTEIICLAVFKIGSDKNLKKFTNKIALENFFIHFQAPHPLFDKDNLSQVKGEVPNESNKGFIFKSDDDYVPISILVNLDL